MTVRKLAVPLVTVSRLMLAGLCIQAIPNTFSITCGTSDSPRRRVRECAVRREARITASDLIEKVEQARSMAESQDWRLHDISIVPIRSAER